MSERFNQYKQSDKREIGYRWVIFDNEMPDEVLRGLMAHKSSPPYEGGVSASRRRGGSLRSLHTESIKARREPPRHPRRVPPLLSKEGSFGTYRVGNKLNYPGLPQLITHSRVQKQMCKEKQCDSREDRERDPGAVAAVVVDFGDEVAGGDIERDSAGDRQGVGDGEA